MRRTFSRTRDQRGFTLIELMIVVNLIGIMMMIAIPSYMTMKNRATDNANKANLREALTSINAYYQDNQTYSGMTIVGLLSFNGGLEVGKYTLTGVTATTYCVQTPQGSGARVWRKNGPLSGFENSSC